MLFARLLSKIFNKKNGIVLIDSQGQKYICGKPNLNNPLTLKLLKKDLNWKLVLNPDLNFPEAYMRGEIEIENGSLLDFLNMTFENIGHHGKVNTLGYIVRRIFHAWRFITNYNLPGRAKVNAQFHYDIGEEKGESLYDLFLDKKHRQYSCAYFLKDNESLENAQQNKINHIIKKLNLKITDKKIYYSKSFELGIPQINLNKLKDKIFGIENNLDELNGIDFKKGCYVGQENTSRIKLRNKLRRRILPVQKITGEIYENDIIKYKDIEIGKIMIDKPYSFALVKVVDPNLKEFSDTELMCGKSKVKILKPEWI